MYFKLAFGNVKRSVRDYSVYFATLAFAACLLYSFTAAGDYLLALDLTEEQRGIYESANMVTQAFSVFSVLVFAFLIAYASRFILRRRSREFAIYGLLGMEPRSISCILAIEGCMVGLGALALGIVVGIGISPLFGAIAAFVFEAPWQPLLVRSPQAAEWTALCFAGIMAFATFLSVRDTKKRTLIQLLAVDRASEEPKDAKRWATRTQAVIAAILLAIVWGCCIVQPIAFIMWILPMGIAAVLATAIVFRLIARAWPRRARRHPERYWKGLRCFTVRQVESHISSSANAMACTCALIAVGICMMVAGFAFSVGMRTPDSTIMDYRAMAPIGFVGIFYGTTFLVSAAAVLALQQLADAADSARRFGMLSNLGCDDEMLRGAIRAQTGTYFAAPLAFALVHAVFGLALVGFLALTLGSSSYALITESVIALTVAFLTGYYLLTCRECERILITH